MFLSTKLKLKSCAWATDYLQRKTFIIVLRENLSPMQISFWKFWLNAKTIMCKCMSKQLCIPFWSLWWLIFCPHRTCFAYISRYTVIWNTTVFLVLVIVDGKINIDDKRQRPGFTPMLFIERTQWLSVFSLKYPKRIKPIFLNVCLCLANQFCSLISRGKLCPYVIIHFEWVVATVNRRFIVISSEIN